jgi:DNA-binding GntR family transcriptional regulator
MATEPVLKKGLSKKEKIYQQIKSEIIAHQLRAGQAITEEQLVNQHAISRTPVREILRRLEHDGLVKNIPYKGTYVADLRREDIEEILDIRYALEGFAARCAAERVQRDDLKYFSEIEKQLEIATKTKNSVLSFECDTKLHELILNISGNTRIHTIISNLSGQIHRIRFISGHIEGRIDSTVKEHLEIINAIKKKDPALAEKKMKIHILTTKKILLQPSQMEEQLTSILSTDNRKGRNR